MGKDRTPPRRPSRGGCLSGLAVQQWGAVGDVTDEPGWVVRLIFDLQTDGVTEVERAVETLVDVLGEPPRLGYGHVHVPAPSPTARNTAILQGAPPVGNGRLGRAPLPQQRIVPSPCASPATRSCSVSL